MKSFIVTYETSKVYSTTIEAENEEEEAREIAEEHWCDLDNHSWNEDDEFVANIECEETIKVDFKDL